MSESGERYVKDASLLQSAKKQNASLYDDIKAENYGKSYGNPTYAVEKLGGEKNTGRHLHCARSAGVNVLQMPMLQKNERDDHRIIC